MDFSPKFIVIIGTTLYSYVPYLCLIKYGMFSTAQANSSSVQVSKIQTTN